jgi:large subunit ribosomal protein L32e
VIIMAAKKNTEEEVEQTETDKKAARKSAPQKKAAKAPAPKESKKAEPKKAKKEEKAQPQKKKKEAPAAEEKAEAVETPEEKAEVKEEAKAEKEEKPFTTVKPRPLPRPVEKTTLDLDEETRRLLLARKANKASLPKFNRLDSHKNKSLGINWRKPKGHHSQMRRQRKAKGSLVKIGFGSPAAVRGLHASGYEEVIVFRPEQVPGIGKTQAIRVAGTVGRKKRTEIEKAAKELNIRVLNPLNVFEEVQ